MAGPAFLLVVFLTAALLTAASLPGWRAWCRRAGLVDDPGRRKIHDSPIPLAGGLAIATGWFLPVFLFFLARRYHLPLPDHAGALVAAAAERSGPLVGLLAGTAAMAALGWVDDRSELAPGLKFAGQCLVAGLVTASGLQVRLPGLQAPEAVTWALTMLWLLTVTNAFNFMDNMNGLCTGLAVIAAILLGCLAIRHREVLLATLAFLTAGAALGFLPWNFPRASAFLGDTGSHLLGFLLAGLALLPKPPLSTEPWAWITLGPILILAVPLADLVWVVLIRWSRGVPFYVGDTNHLSHRLVSRGLTRARAVALIWVAAAAIGCGALLFQPA